MKKEEKKAFQYYTFVETKTLLKTRKISSQCSKNVKIWYLITLNFKQMLSLTVSLQIYEE